MHGQLISFLCVFCIKMLYISYKWDLIFEICVSKKKTVKYLYKTFVFLQYIQLHNRIKTELK